MLVIRWYARSTSPGMQLTVLVLAVIIVCNEDDDGPMLQGKVLLSIATILSVGCHAMPNQEWQTIFPAVSRPIPAWTSLWCGVGTGAGPRALLPMIRQWVHWCMGGVWARAVCGVSLGCSPWRVKARADAEPCPSPVRSPTPLRRHPISGMRIFVPRLERHVGRPHDGEELTEARRRRSLCPTRCRDQVSVLAAPDLRLPVLSVAPWPTSYLTHPLRSSFWRSFRTSCISSSCEKSTRETRRRAFTPRFRRSSTPRFTIRGRAVTTNEPGRSSNAIWKYNGNIYVGN